MSSRGATTPRVISSYSPKKSVLSEGRPCFSPLSLFGVPPALQAVGIYDLESPELSQYSGIAETWDLHEDPYGPDDCAQGFGAVSGTLEILAIDDSAVRFRVTLVDSVWKTDPSGEYVAPRCP
jgi:hypothetical protein